VTVAVLWIIHKVICMILIIKLSVYAAIVLSCREMLISPV